MWIKRKDYNNLISDLEHYRKSADEIERLKNDKLELESIARYYEYKYAELKVKQNEKN